MAGAARVPFLDQLYNHIVLPLNVPGREDGNLHRVEEALLKRMLDAVARLTPHVAADIAPHVQGLQKTLLTCQVLNVDGTIGKAALIKELRDFDYRKMLVLHIAPQNCALLIYVQKLTSGERHIVFEAFETSATADKVLTAKGALQWDFPGCAVSVPASTFTEEAFQEALATFIEQASSESVTKFAAVTGKAAATIPEIRDTSDPALISGLLMTILEANGAAVGVPRLRKRVRDTVTFDNARTPWRRSAFYLVLRVAVQRYLYHHLGAEVGRLHYKTLMCLLHAQLLEDVLKRMPFDAAFSLRQKLGRRLAKLTSDVHGANRSSLSGYSNPLLCLEASFETTLSTTGGYLKQVWRTHKHSRERFIPKLRPYAHADEFQLRLMNSGRFLGGILAEHVHRPRSQQRTAPELLQLYERSVACVKPYMKALSSHIASSKLLEDVVLPAKQSTQQKGLRAIKLSRVIRQYVAAISAVEQAYPNQMSQQLLHLMELWVLMDRDAVACYPLLGEYHPGLDAAILDPVQLLTHEELVRSQEVRVYLTSRYRARSNARSRTIFDDPTDDCFAAQYYDREDLQSRLPAIREKIEQAADVAYEAKNTEWEEKSKRHEQMIDKRNEKECIYDTTVALDGMTESRHRRPCDWHDLHYEAKGIRIQIHEHPLPSYEPTTKAVLFELQCPEIFAAYRDATWLIMSTLCHKPINPTDKLDRMSLIREYSQLQPYVNKTSSQVTLGSYKKAHLECHYANWGFPIGLDEVIRTCGLKPKYYDSLGEVWTHKSEEASFWHHFPVKLSPSSPLVSLGLDYANWPTSNEIQASQARCPQGVGIHEFTALQGLLVGTHSRWLDLVRELGSTNINLSSESTWLLVLRLVLQLGPDTAVGSAYTDVHRPLLNDDLCSKLLQQIRYRLEAIQRNWREPVQMDILITILLKMTSLTPITSVCGEGVELLHEARKITDGWRKELQSMVTEDPNVLQSAIWASLLCKRTMHINEPLKDPEGLRMYLDASISLQYNLAGSFDAMPYNMRNAIAQDTLFAYEHRDNMRRVIVENVETFKATLDAVWHVPGDYDTTEPGLETVSDTWYLSYTLWSAAEQRSYFVHYDYVYGTLLIDGKEMRTLPQAYRMDATYRHALGDKNPIVYPSPLRGMDFTLSESIRGHRIHLGYRNSRLIIRADQDGELLEFIPSDVFGLDSPTPDLPRPLVEGCYHWLHVYSGHIEIRQNNAWTSKLMSWWIHWHPSGFYHAVRRFGEPKQTTLLDAGSELVKSITRIFTHFEFSSQILVFASIDGRIFVELKRMELSFHIN